eukprot:jgi/Tetstr1/430451/TSEL_020261.t1
MSTRRRPPASGGGCAPQSWPHGPVGRAPPGGAEQNNHNHRPATGRNHTNDNNGRPQPAARAAWQPPSAELVAMATADLHGERSPGGAGGAPPPVWGGQQRPRGGGSSTGGSSSSTWSGQRSGERGPGGAGGAPPPVWGGQQRPRGGGSSTGGSSSSTWSGQRSGERGPGGAGGAPPPVWGGQQRPRGGGSSTGGSSSSTWSGQRSAGQEEGSAHGSSSAGDAGPPAAEQQTRNGAAGRPSNPAATPAPGPAESPPPTSSWAALLGTWAGAEPQPQPRAAATARPAAAALSPEEELRRQAYLSKLSPSDGKLHCLACNKVMASYPALMHHLKDKHRGVNSLAARWFDAEDAPSTAGGGSGRGGGQQRATVSLFDWMTPARGTAGAQQPPQQQRGARAEAFPSLRPDPRSAPPPRQPAHPSLHPPPPKRSAAGGPQRTVAAAELGGAGVGLGGGAGTTGRLVLRGARKKKPSKLKRVILRERADRGLEAAQAALAAARAAAAAAAAREAGLRRELDGAVATARQPAPGSDSVAGRLPPELFLRVQVLEVGIETAKAAVEAARKKVGTAEEGLAAAQEAHRKAYNVPAVDGDPEGGGGEEADWEEEGEEAGEGGEGLPAEGLGAGGRGAPPPLALSAHPPPPPPSVAPSVRMAPMGGGAPTAPRRPPLWHGAAPGPLPAFSLFNQSSAPGDDSDSDDDGALPGFENALSSWMVHVPAPRPAPRGGMMVPSSVLPAPTSAQKPARPPPQPQRQLAKPQPPQSATPIPAPVPVPVPRTSPPVSASTASNPARPAIPTHVMDRYQALMGQVAPGSPAAPTGDHADSGGDSGSSSGEEEDSEGEDGALGFEDALSRWRAGPSAAAWSPAAAAARPVAGSAATLPAWGAGGAPALGPAPVTSPPTPTHPQPQPQTPPAPAPSPAPAQPPQLLPARAEVDVFSSSDEEEEDEEGQGTGTGAGAFTNILAGWISNVSTKLAPLDHLGGGGNSPGGGGSGGGRADPAAHDDEALWKLETPRPTAAPVAGAASRGVRSHQLHPPPPPPPMTILARPAALPPSWTGQSFAAVLAGLQAEAEAQGLAAMAAGGGGNSSGGSDGEGSGRGRRMPPAEIPLLAAELGVAEEFCVGRIHCAVCGLDLHGLVAFKQHCTGRRHLSKLQASAHKLLPASEEGAPAAGATSAAPGRPAATAPPTYLGLESCSREYCNQIITPELNQVVDQLLRQLRAFQERAIAKDPIKGKMRKRLVAGLREVNKAVKLKKAHSVVVVPNIESVSSEGGLDDRLSGIMDLAKQNGTPVVFALSLKKLGQVFGQRKKISAVAILDVNGANEAAAEMLRRAAGGREAWAAAQDARSSAPPPPAPAASSPVPALNPAAAAFVPSWL